MKSIKSVKVASLFSFGPEQYLDEFKTFNLFIGENGTGKTSILKILDGLPVSFMRNPYIQNNTFIPNLIDIINIYQNRSSVLSDLPKKLEIEYEEGNGELTRIVLGERSWDGNPKFSGFEYVQGDISRFISSGRLVELPENELEFFKDITTSFGLGASSSINKLPLLNFGIFYIFGVDYHFTDQGVFIKGNKSPQNRIQSDDTKSLPSGVLYCAQLLVKYLLVRQSVILIDEPELHLEPRIIRRFIHFIIWLNVRFKKERTEEENRIFSIVERVMLDNITSHANGETSSKWVVKGISGSIDIPSTSDHPIFFQKQIFIASHSPILINEFLRLSDSSVIYKFENELKKYNAAHAMTSEELHQEEELFSTIKKIENNTDISLLLDNLGVKGSDILQTNGVIWVEGPSDVIYIKKWLEMYISENHKTDFAQGRDYEFQMYGGTLLDSLCLIKDGEDEREEYKKLVSMFSFSRNAFVVIDSDAVIYDINECIDKSKFKNAKNFIKEQFQNLSGDSNSLGLWYKEGDTEVRTMESYLDEDSRDFIKSSWTKKIAAQKVTENWRSGKTLAEFPNNLKNEIEVMYQTIETWNY